MRYPLKQTMETRSVSRPLVLAAAASLFCVTAPSGWTATIRLKDKTTVKGKVVRVSDDGVLVSLPRASIESINGKPLPPALVEGAAAPPFQVRDIQGNPQALPAPANMNGGPGGAAQGRVTVLHFWVSWCPHCGSDAHKIEALYTQFRAHSKVAIVTVSLDEQREALDRFVKDRHVTYPVIDAAEQAKAPGGVDLAELYHVNGFPVTYLIDAQGIIKRKIHGSFVETGVDLASELQKQL